MKCDKILMCCLIDQALQYIKISYYILKSKLIQWFNYHYWSNHPKYGTWGIILYMWNVSLIRGTYTEFSSGAGKFWIPNYAKGALRNGHLYLEPF